MTWRSELDDDALRSIFEEQLRPFLDAGSSAVVEVRPRLVFVGAQPGAGKTRTLDRVLQEHRHLVPVLGDDFRPLHPDYNALMDTDPAWMPAVTAQASGRWVEMSLEYLRSARRSVLLETTLRQPDTVERTAHAFSAAGYGAELRALAVPGAVSRLSTVTRYFTDAQERGRWAPSTAHDAAFAAMPGTVDRLVRSGLVDRVVVATRSGRTLMDRRVGVDAAATADEARRALAEGRDVSSLSAADGEAWVREYVQAAHIAAGAERLTVEQVRTLRRLEQDGQQLVRASVAQADAPRMLQQLQSAAAVLPPLPTRRAANPDTGPVTRPGPTGMQGPSRGL